MKRSKGTIEKVAIVCEGVTFGYLPDQVVLQDISFQVPQGQILGLLGPNGAGKTTLIRLLLGLLRPRTGNISIMGGAPYDPRIRRHVGVVHQTAGFEQFLSGWDNLYIHGRFWGMSPRDVRRRVQELSALFGEFPFLQLPVISLSGGQRRRLQLLRALLPRPTLLLLDEPTAGLDVEGRQALYQALHHIVIELQATVIWTSHYLAEIEQNCERILILLDGQIALDARTKDLLCIEEIHITLEEDNSVSEEVLQALGVRVPAPRELLYQGDPKSFYQHVLPELLQRGLIIRHLSHRSPNLEEVYLNITRK